MRSLALVLVACSVVTAAGAQEINPKDPAAVAKAYLDGCEKWDAEAAGKFALDADEAQALQAVGEATFRAYLEQGLAEVLCLPISSHVRYTVGETTVTGQECHLQAVATGAVPLTLVLRRGDDGNWRVAVRESILSTTGAQEPMLFGNAPGMGGQAQTVADEQTACQANLKQLMLGILMYAQDHDEVLPPAETWRDELMPYLKSIQVFQCPLNPWGYTYNSALSRKPLAQIANPSEMIALFEVGHAEPNMAAELTKVKWAHRHNGGDDVGYVDGHVKWLAGQ